VNLIGIGVIGISDVRILIESLLNLSHPCILVPIDFIFRMDSTVPAELKIIQFDVESLSLSEVISKNSVWWTATVKAKTVAGIGLSL
jgi:hypothetical protein